MMPQQKQRDIRGFSLTQPWASGVIEEFKKYETRSWRTKYTGLLAIHASKDFPGWAKREHESENGIFRETLNRPWTDLPTGAILGVVELTGCHPTGETIIEYRGISQQELEYGDWSAGRYCWEFRNVMKLQYPIPIKGALQLWTLPGDIKANLLNLYEGEYDPTEHGYFQQPEQQRLV